MEIPSPSANSRESEQQIPLTWTLRQQLGYCESLTAGNNPTSFGETPNSAWYPLPCTLVYEIQQIWKGSQGSYHILEREMSVYLKKSLNREGACFRQPLCPQLLSTLCSNLMFLEQRSELLPAPEFLVWVMIWKVGLDSFPAWGTYVCSHLQNISSLGTRNEGERAVLSYARNCFTFHMHKRVFKPCSITDHRHHRTPGMSHHLFSMLKITLCIVYSSCYPGRLIASLQLNQLHKNHRRQTVCN